MNQQTAGRAFGSLAEFVVGLLVNSLAVFITAYVLPGVVVASFMVALIVAVVLGAINTFIRPLLIVLTLPITVLTLGVFILVINALLILLVDWLVAGFDVRNFWWALLFSLVLALVSGFLNSLQRRRY